MRNFYHDCIPCSIPVTFCCAFSGANANSSAPYPSENHRIQIYGMHFRSYLLISTSLVDDLSSLTALFCALDDLLENFEDAYNTSLQNDDIEIWDEKQRGLSAHVPSSSPPRARLA